MLKLKQGIKTIEHLLPLLLAIRMQKLQNCSFNIILTIKQKKNLKKHLLASLLTGTVQKFLNCSFNIMLRLKDRVELPHYSFTLMHTSKPIVNKINLFFAIAAYNSFNIIPTLKQVISSNKFTLYHEKVARKFLTCSFNIMHSSKPIVK